MDNCHLNRLSACCRRRRRGCCRRNHSRIRRYHRSAIRRRHRRRRHRRRRLGNGKFLQNGGDESGLFGEEGVSGVFDDFHAPFRPQALEFLGAGNVDDPVFLTPENQAGDAAQSIASRVFGESSIGIEKRVLKSLPNGVAVSAPVSRHEGLVNSAHHAGPVQSLLGKNHG